MAARRANHWCPKTLTSVLLSSTIVGVIVGLWVVHNASYPYSQAIFDDPFAIFVRQVKYAVLGFGLAVLAFSIPLGLISRFGWTLHLLSIVLLLLTLFFGKKVGEAQRWLSIGSIQFQPSEFAKITLIICIAFLAHKWETAANIKQRFWIWVAIFSVWSLTVTLVLAQPHLSGGLLVAIIGIATMFFARLPIYLVLATLFLGFGVGYIGQEYLLHSYQRERLQSVKWLNFSSERENEQKAYQVRQALLGLQVGGWFGQGANRGRQKHLFLPAAHTDFVFAVIGEEFGFAGSFIVIFFFGAITYFGLCVASQAKDAFAAGLAGAIAFSLWLQATLHILVNINLLPPTGFPLPFLSAGGSSLCAILLGMGLLLNVSKNLVMKAKGRGGTENALGDGRWRDWGTHLPSHRHRRRRQINFA
ncbi:MAG: FtsW/RodA/SpoVE family cell cycle protein [Armatimonadetes bacterium]|nr:FtsW/RodA/SpoVE family cell cycle protein [Armatimonadota bacterium]MDW8028787.1 FtsW/RodA/SpoVE family cell cycle protein [Armatimonadota bacterium]